MRAYKKMMRLVGTKIIWDNLTHVACKHCKSEWLVIRTQWGRLPEDWWKCHCGCSDRVLASKKNRKLSKKENKLFY